MKSFGRWVVEHYKAIIVMCILLLIPAVYGMVNTRINYDLLTYLPDNLNSTKGQAILEKDFRVAGNAFLMIEGKDDWRVQHLRQEIEKVPGVEKAIWIDNWADITIPREFVPEQVVNQYYKGDDTLMQIQFKAGAGDERTVTAIRQIEKLLDKSSYLGGTSAIISDLRTLIDHERVLYLIIAVILVFLILILTLSSSIVPLLFLISIGFAVVYNMGTNLFLGQISYVTSAIAAVLQLGVTMDFSIFLMHRYLEEKRKTTVKEEAMATAIEKTFIAIGASSLTAIAGFLSLGVMQIGLGKDMGTVMAKGVALGVLISLTLLPAMILACDGIISRFQHRTFLPSFNWTARLVAKRYWVLFILLIVLIFPAWYGKEHVKVLYSLTDALPQNMQSIKSTDYIKQCFGEADTLYLVTPSGEEWKVKELSKEIRDMKGIVGVVAPSDLTDPAIPQPYIPQKLRESFSNGKYDYTIVQSKYHPADPQAARLIKQIRTATGKYFATSYLSGESVLTDDMISLADHDRKKVELYSIAAILAILALAFTSLSLPFFLVLVIELAILFNLGMPFYLGKSISFIALMSIGAIQLGSCVNYAILMVSRYREELAKHDKFIAIQNAVRGTGGSIVTSALALSAGTIGVGMISKVQMISSLASMIARGAFISMFAILFFLPPLLVVLQEIISHTTLRWPRSKKIGEGLSNEEGF